MNDVFRYLTTKIDEQLTNIEADLAAGKCADFGEYKFGCGIYRGLLVTKGILQEAHEAMDQDYED